MRFIAAVFASLLFCTMLLAKKVDLADYPVSINILSYETSQNSGRGVVQNLNTGVITGTAMTTAWSDREEIQIGDTVYITQILRGCRHCQNLVIGKSYQARLYQRRTRLFQSPSLIIEYLQLPTHGTEYKKVSLEVVGQRALK